VGVPRSLLLPTELSLELGHALLEPGHVRLSLLRLTSKLAASELELGRLALELIGTPLGRVSEGALPVKRLA
jgi:hypothetical protein